MMINKSLLAASIVLLAMTGSAFAEPYVYPSKGQSAQQMEKDKYQCYG